MKRPASGGADLRFGCPLVPVVVRRAWMLRGPSGAQRALVAWSVWHHSTSGARPFQGGPVFAGKPDGGGAAADS